MPGSVSEHGDEARAERPLARPHSRGLLSPGQVLSPTNAAPTKQGTAQHENTVRGGAFAHTNTEKGQRPFRTPPGERTTTGRTPFTRRPIRRPPCTLHMGAVGFKGQVLDGTGASGLAVNIKSDAMWVGTKSGRTGNERADAPRLGPLLRPDEGCCEMQWRDAPSPYTGRRSSHTTDRPKGRSSTHRFRKRAKLTSGGFVNVERPRAQLRGIHLNEAEAVPACKGGTRVDVPAIGEPLHLVQHEVPVHQGPKPRDRPAAVAANLILGRIGAKKRNVDMVRRPRLEHPRRDGPVRMRNECLHSDKSRVDEHGAAAPAQNAVDEAKL